MEKKTLGSFLAALRKANGMTQKDLAERLNVSDKAVSRWERDENCPDLTLIPVIADIFGVTSDELLRGERTSTESRGTSERSDKQIQLMTKNLVFRYIIGTLIAVAATIGGFILRRSIAMSVGTASNYYGSESSISAGVWTAVSTTVAYLVWLAALLFIILRFWVCKRELAVVEDSKHAENAKKKLSRTFRVAIIFLISFLFLIMGAGETGSDFELFFILFLAFFVGLNIAVPLIRRAVAGIRRGSFSNEQAKEEYRGKATVLTVVFLAIWGVVLFLGLMSEGSIFAPGKWFFREESFREYMETSTDDHWNPCAFASSLFGEPAILENIGWHLKVDENGAETREYEWSGWDEEFGPDRFYRIGDSPEFQFRNRKVYWVLFFSGGSGLPIHTCTEFALYIGWAITVLLMIAVPVVYYLLLRRARNRLMVPAPKDDAVREKIERYSKIVFPPAEDEAAATEEVSGAAEENDEEGSEIKNGDLS